MAIINGSKVKQESSLEEKVIEYKEKEGKRYRVIPEEDDEDSHINSFIHTFEQGLKGENILLSTGFPKLDEYMTIRKKVSYLIGAYTGSGKTTFIDECFVFNPCEWYLQQTNPNIDLKIIYWSLERSMDEKIARWISRKIFLNHQIIIAPDEILSRKIGIKLVKDKEMLVRKYIESIREIMDKVLTVHCGATNPNDIYKRVKDFAEKRGKKEIVIVRKSNGYEYFKTIYIPDNPREFVLLVADPVNRIRTEMNSKEGKRLTKKEAIDKLSEHFIDARDLYGYATLLTSQFNRGIVNPLRLNSERGVSPSLEDFKETGNLAEDAEVVLSVFDPSYFKVDDIYGYDLTKLKEGRTNRLPGNKKYRQLHILKNSYGPNDVGIGLAFQPQCGIFSEMKHKNDMTDEDYNSILDDSYFLKNRTI